jgi:hypothetical protein
MSSSSNPYLALGLPQPKKTFLDARKPTSEPPKDGTPRNADAVILGEHKVELTDMLQESVAMLKNVYRSKFVFGEHLKFVDPSFSGDTVNRFNLTTPPVFDAAYASQNSAAVVPSQAQGGNSDAPNANSNAEGGGGGDSASKERLRTAEELIKKLYRRNNQLEVENKYFKAEIQRFERLAGLGRSPSHTLTVYDGHIPNDHPLYVKKLKRHCRSCPPTRTLLRSSVDGFGLTFPPMRNQNAGFDEGTPAKEDPPAVSMLKRRVMQLTEALVTIQHENEKLTQEKVDRITLRDNILKRYIMERDTQISQLHTSLQDVLAKVHNPMKLTRTRQPSSSMSPVVAANNVLKEISQKLSDSIAATADEIVKKATQAMPPSAADDDANDAALEAKAVGMRRKELANRLRQIADGMPVSKRKQLLLLLTELKQLYESLVNSNKSLLQTYEDHMRGADKKMIGLKIQVTSMKDQLRSLCVTEEDSEVVEASRPNAQVPAPSGQRVDP